MSEFKTLWPETVELAYIVQDELVRCGWWDDIQPKPESPGAFQARGEVLKFLLRAGLCFRRLGIGKDPAYWFMTSRFGKRRLLEALRRDPEGFAQLEELNKAFGPRGVAAHIHVLTGT